MAKIISQHTEHDIKVDGTLKKGVN
jgi:hypothetical protein